MPSQPSDFISVDSDRRRRCGAAEVIFAAKKTPEQIISITQSLLKLNEAVLCTRIAKHDLRGIIDAVFKILPTGWHLTESTEACCFSIVDTTQQQKDKPKPSIGIIAAGTSDMAVSQEAAFCAEFFGMQIKVSADVGVAGIHRLLKILPSFSDCKALIVIAGMEGALPSVVAGLTTQPVIAVPTSVGYGSNLAGLTPMLAMLTSCAEGIAVVNIDNGYGAAAFARRLTQC